MANRPSFGGRRTSAWFPKMADLSKGKPEPGDKWCGWCNTISEDGTKIYMNNFENPERLMKDLPDYYEPHVTFIKLPRSKVYQFAGVFIRKYRDKELGWVYEPIAEDINTNDYI